MSTEATPPGAATSDGEPEWLADGTPFSREFGDVYYSREDGCAEARHVFLHHNALAQRWAQLADDARTLFVIGETGFGTGLNFLLAWQLWERAAPASARLVFRSLEAFPLAPRALARALERWNELQPLARQLIAAWPPLLPGLHTLEFAGGRVTLQLFVGDARHALEEFGAAVHPELAAKVDAWFLDGFAPSRNPDMWNAGLMASVAALSKPGSTFATFTVAAAVRAALAGSGFVLTRQPGFGSKREMLTGAFEGSAGPGQRAPLRATPWHLAAAPRIEPRTAIVIGAGIAGCTAARALARRGWEVTVLEAEREAANGGSGNPQAVLFTQLPGSDTPHCDFTLHSFLYALRFYGALGGAGAGGFDPCGLLQLCGPDSAADIEKLRARFAPFTRLARFVDAAEASALAGVNLERGGIHLPGSGWMIPRQACARALDHPRVDTRFDSTVTALEQAAGGWTVTTADGRRLQAAAVVLANASAANALLGEAWLPLAPLRGQITLVPQDRLAQAPRCVICAEGYVAPPLDGQLCCGASFRRGGGSDRLPTAEESRENLGRLQDILPGFDAGALDAAALPGRVGYRATTPDRLPAAGPVPDAASFLARYDGLRRNARLHIDRPGEYRRGLFVSTGHGSRGMTSAPLCAEAVAAALSGEPSPLPDRLLRALSPARFLVRRMVKGQPA